MPKYMIIDIRNGSVLNLTTKKKKFLQMMGEAKEYLEMPKWQQDLFKKWCKTKCLKMGKY